MGIHTMTTLSTTLPFSLSMANERGETNGFSIAESLSEFVDNTFDANGREYILVEVNVPGGPTYLISVDVGNGAADLLPLYGIGASVRRKTGVTRGLKNAGHRAALGRFNPDTVHHISRTRENPRASSLVLDLQTLWEIVDAAKGAGDCDYRRIDEQMPRFLRNMSNCGFTDEIRELLSEIIVNTPPSPERTLFENILSNSQESYHAMIMKYAERPVTLINEITSALHSFRISYYDALMDGRTITFASHERIVINRENAVDPLGTAPRIKGTVDIRTRGDATTYLKVTLSVSDADPSTFYMSYNPGDTIFFDGKTHKNPFTTKEPQADWEEAAVVDRLEMEFSVPSAKEEHDQLKTVGSTIYGKVENMRGIYLGYIDRYLGMPLYNTKGWQDKRNISGFRGRIRCMSSKTMEEFMGIQKKKHSSTFENLHPAIQMFLNWICNRVIISKYSHTGNNKGHAKGDSPGVTDWNFPQFCQFMMNTKVPPSSPPSSPSLPSPSQSENNSSSNAGTPVPAHFRQPPKSPHEFIEEIHKFVEKVTVEKLDELLESASNIAVAGLSTKIKQLHEILSELETLGLTCDE
jgi:hypothetical protein